MIDTTLKYIPVIMLNEHLGGYPHYALPDGYSFDFYSPETGVSDWIRVQKASLSLKGDGHEQLFMREFSGRDDLLTRQMLFVRDKNAAPVATATLWHGDAFGVEMPLLHWVATDVNHQERGIMKALLTRIFDMSVDLGVNCMYLVTQTNSYAAVNLYDKFGFKRVLSPKPTNFRLDDFASASKEAWEMIDAKIEAYKIGGHAYGGTK